MPTTQTDAARSTRTPVLLRNNPPLIEALCEIRFKSAFENVGAILLGPVFKKFHGPNQKFEQTAFPQLPAQLTSQIPALANIAYTPRFRLSGDGRAIAVGDCIVAVSLQQYSGWANLKSFLGEVWTEVATLGLNLEIERISTKYVNLLEGIGPGDLTRSLNVVFTIGQTQQGEHKSLFLREERQIDDCTVVTQIISPATVNTGIKSGRSGLILDIDVIKYGPIDNFNSAWTDEFETVHAIAERTFFGLLTEEALSGYDPQYSDL